jgi:predicted metal-dependent phosphoesterase TrpH/glycosyltransferase involved in cell wall biosynthesis
VPAATERDPSPFGHHELTPFGIDDAHRPLDLVRPVGASLDRDLRHAATVTGDRATAGAGYTRPTVGLRICFVTPFAWSQPHEVNVHVTGVAEALRRRGHSVTVLAPSSRARDLLSGRRTLQRAEDADVIVVGPSVPVSRRTHLGVPVAVRANLRLALSTGRYDVVHGFEPGLPSISYLALTTSRALTAATFFSAERLGYPARRSRRDRLRIRVDALLATSEATATAAASRFPGEYALVPIGVDTDRFRPAQKRRVIALELEPAGRMVTRSVLRAARSLSGWEILLLHTKPLAFRPAIPRSVRERTHVRTVRSPEQRAATLAEAAIFVAAPGGEERLALEAASCGAVVVDEQTAESVAARVQELVEDEQLRGRLSAESRDAAERESFEVAASELEQVYSSLRRKRRLPARAGDMDGDPLAGRDWITIDLHLHTDRSHDCSIPASDLLEHAERIGLGGIAVTDHNVFGGAQEAVGLARGGNLVVIPGEEVKTHDQGEVIGLFLHEEIPRGLGFGETIAAIREQGGLVYLPHPFDRLHAIPDPATLHAHLAEIDVLEVFNARLLRDSFNDEALRFARKYRLLQGAGSDAHVLQGVGTGAMRMRRFDGPEEFLLSLRTAEVLRRPKSLAYLQSLKWVAQVKEKVR